MLEELGWESLESRRTKLQLTNLYKIHHNLLDIPASKYLVPSTSFTRSKHSLKYDKKYSPSSDHFKNSFFVSIINPWNSLPAVVAEAPSLALFKRELANQPF